MMNLEGKTIVVSRTDSIGDVMLTLPLAWWIKQKSPTTKIIFLGKSYTKPVVAAYKDVDQFEDWDLYREASSAVKLTWLKSLNADVFIHVFPQKELATLAKRAEIPQRIGTSHRLFHLLTCNKRINFSRKNSDLHEAQLNFELLRPLGLHVIPNLKELNSATASFIPNISTLPSPFEDLKNYVILHPKSQGSAREWPISKYMELSEKLVKAGKKVVFTGTEKEGLLFRSELPKDSDVFDSTGKLSLEQLIVLIGASDGLLACSTGPLHIAGFSDVRAVGLFSPKRPIHPGRWRALGEKVRILVNENCSACANNESCDCMENITVEEAFNALTRDDWN